MIIKVCGGKVLYYAPRRKSEVAVMAQAPPDPGWIKLEVALIWILTRDSKAVAQYVSAAQATRQYVRPAVAQSVRQHFGSYRNEWNVPESDWRKAWSELRKAVTAGEIELRGEPYEERTADAIAAALSAPPVSLINFDLGDEEEEEDDFEDASSHLEMIAQSEAAKLDLDDSCLRPASWALDGGRGWRNVIVARDNLLQAFPPKGASAPTFLPTTQSDYEDHIVVTAFKRRYPKGVPQGTLDKVRDAEIGIYLEKKMGTSLSPITIRRQMAKFSKKRDQK